MEDILEACIGVREEIVYSVVEVKYFRIERIILIQTIYLDHVVLERIDSKMPCHLPLFAAGSLVKGDGN